MKNTKIEFNTRSYVMSHGREPRGYGSWAFDLGGRGVVFAPASTYTAAKKWAREVAALVSQGRARVGLGPVVTIEVCS
jgi:hypothetical protein